MALRTEFKELKDKWAKARLDGRISLDEILELASEAIDVADPVLAALQPGNQEAVDSLSDELTQLLLEAVKDLPSGRFLGRQAAITGVNLGVPWVVQGAATSGFRLRVWFDANVLPASQGIESVLHKFNVKFAA